MHGLGTTAGRILVELVLATFPQRYRKGIPKSYRVTQTEVHALPTCRAVRVCGVAGEQYHPAGPVLVRHPLVDPEPGSPDHFSHPHRRTPRPSVVEQSLRIDD